MPNDPLDNLEKAAAEEEWEEEIRKEVKELLDEKPKQPAKAGAGSDYGRAQRNVATDADKTVYDPDFGKPRPDPNKTVYDPDFGKPKPPKQVVEVEKGVKPDAATRKLKPAKPKPKPTASQILENIEKKALEEGEDEIIRKEVKELLDEKPKKPAKPAGPKTKKFGTTKLAATKVKPKASSGIGRALKAGSTLKTLGKIVGIGAVVGVIGFAILDHLGVAIFEHAADVALEKMGPKTDLSAYLPGGSKAKKVVWSAASYRRYNADPVSSEDLALSNVVGEEITLHPPKNGILALGISLADLPELFVPEINVNELGDGQSDWLCEEYQGYLICRSLGSFPLNSKLKTVVTLYFHLPAYEVKEMIAAGGGSRAVYFIVNK